MICLVVWFHRTPNPTSSGFSLVVDFLIKPTRGRVRESPNVINSGLQDEYTIEPLTKFPSTDDYLKN